MIGSASAQDRAAVVSRQALAADPSAMSDPKTWRVEYEKALLDEAVRRMRRQPPHVVRAWTLVSGMTRFERALVGAWLFACRIGDALRGRIRP